MRPQGPPQVRELFYSMGFMQCSVILQHSIVILLCHQSVSEFGKCLRVSVVRECKSNLAIAKIKYLKNDISFLIQ